MKKSLAFSALLLAVVLLLAACGKPASSDNPASSEGASSVALPGGYTDERALTEDDWAVWAEGTKDMEAMDNHTPLAVSTQVVAGTNYRFRVEVVTDEETYQAYVNIFKPLEDSEECLFISEERI